MNEITLNEFKEIFKFIIENNRRLEDEGKKTTACSASGNAGLGKTAVVRQIAEELGMTCVVVRLSQIDEASDLVGFPIKEYEVIDDKGQQQWLSNDIIQTLANCRDYTFTGKSRMGYAPPAWLPREENPNGTILYLDDFSRCNSLLMNSVLEIINEGKYVSWSLPKYTTVALSENPDNGEYLVSSMDAAAKSRYVCFNIKFSIDNFAEWAEGYGMDSRAINFGLYYNSELFDPSHPNHLDTINPRSYTTFTNIISGIKNWDKPESLALILNISKGCFHDPNNVVGSLFTSFIANKLDKLVTPEDMLMKKWDTVREDIEKCVYEKEDYHPEIAAVLNTRLLNYSVNYLKDGNKADVVCNRLLDLIDNSNSSTEKHLFSEDLIFSIIKTIVSKFPAKTNKLLLNPAVRKKIL
jgi:hypothetical protein